jgi:hypothetical protein
MVATQGEPANVIAHSGDLRRRHVIWRRYADRRRTLSALLAMVLTASTLPLDHGL